LAVSLLHNMTIALVILRGIGEPPSKRSVKRRKSARNPSDSTAKTVPVAVHLRLCILHVWTATKPELQAQRLFNSVHVFPRQGPNLRLQPLFADCRDLIGHGLARLAIQIDCGFTRVKAGNVACDRDDLRGSDSGPSDHASASRSRSRSAAMSRYAASMSCDKTWGLASFSRNWLMRRRPTVRYSPW
jgi:hypothetical protein